MYIESIRDAYFFKTKNRFNFKVGPVNRSFMNAYTVAKGYIIPNSPPGIEKSASKSVHFFTWGK